jgi:antitoxin component YwqK of YwqJK toxin-antitoxin module
MYGEILKLQNMKNILIIAIFCIAAIGYAQDIKPTYEAEGNLVKATYFHEDGSVKTEGYFKNKKLTGKWTRFDKQGNKTQLAFYKEGKKTGKWFFWNEGSLKEVTYNNNTIEGVNLWKTDAKLAVNR